MVKTIAFDPGYSKYMTSFIQNIRYMYFEIGKYKNIGQKKFQFKNFYPQVLSLIEQHVEFYLGCMLWGTCVASKKGYEIDGNKKLGSEYNEESELLEINFILDFVEQFNKDTKYYLNKTYEFPEEYKQILDTYKEFLTANKGFVNAKMSDDIVIPESLKTPPKTKIKKLYDTITTEIVTKGNFKMLLDLKNMIL